MPALEGLYRRHEGDFLDANLRFYRDGRVVAVTTYRTTPQEVARWLAYDSINPPLSQGTYTIEGDHITFTTVSPNGAIDFTGTIEADGAILTLVSHSHINGHRDLDTYLYTFVQFEC